METSLPARNGTSDHPEQEYTSIHWTKSTLNVTEVSVFHTNAILAILPPVKMNKIEGTRPNSCSQAFARWNQEVKTSSMGSKYFSSIEFYWYQNMIYRNISHWHSQDTNLRNSRAQVHPYGGVGYFSNERGFSVESSLQRILSKFLLWKRNKLSVVFKSDLDEANLRPALEQGCGKQTPSARKIFFRANLLFVSDIKI